MKNVAIIGAGYTGLAIAKKLIEIDKKDFNITIYEKENEVGGMVRTIEKLGTNIDRHYRHIFKSDKYVIDLANKFNIEIIWPKTQMGYFMKNKIFEFGTPISLLKFKPLNFFEKIKFGIGIIDLKLTRNWKKFENVTAEKYIIRKYGENIYKTIWEPLLISKFGKKKSEISMTWLWGKISLRSSSTSFNGERLGYIKGSYKKLTNQLYNFLISNNCKIKLNCEVKKIIEEKNKYFIETELNLKEKYDIVISTVSNNITKKIYQNCLDDEQQNNLSKLEYSLAKTLIIISKKPLTKYYWINIGQPNIPFNGIIEQTNLLSKEEYQNLHIIYISNYMYEDDELYRCSSEELLKIYFPTLKMINSKFNENDIIETILCEDKFAQPIIKTNYSKEKINYKIKNKNLYIANMSQIYPQDRGMNYAIKLGYDLANLIIKDIIEEEKNEK